MAGVWLTPQGARYVPKAVISLGRAVASSCWTLVAVSGLEQGAFCSLGEH